MRAVILALVLACGGCFSSEPAKPRSAFDLARRVDAPEPELVAALEALGDSADERSFLIEKSVDPRPKVRRSAVARLGGMNAPEAVPALEKAAKDKDGRVRRQALESLAMIQDPARAEAVERLAKASGWSPQEEAALSAARFRSSADSAVRRQALSRLIELAGPASQDRMVRIEAALLAMGAAPQEKEVLRMLRTRVEDALKDRGEPRLTGRAIDHLIQFKDSWPAENFMRLCLSSDVRLRESAMILAGLKPDDRVRTGRRLVEEGWRKRYCAQMRPKKKS